jgi:hypothetical protein
MYTCVCVRVVVRGACGVACMEGAALELERPVARRGWRGAAACVVWCGWAGVVRSGMWAVVGRGAAPPTVRRGDCSRSYAYLWGGRVVGRRGRWARPLVWSPVAARPPRFFFYLYILCEILCILAAIRAINSSRRQSVKAVLRILF